MKQKARNLSGGQKQRLAIARAIVNKPSIIFADEPTGNLDSATGEKIEDLLFGLNKQGGSTLIIVTHDSELAQKCDTQIYMKDGKVERIEGATLAPKEEAEEVVEEKGPQDSREDSKHLEGVERLGDESESEEEK